jgi:hypothetical protein
VLHQNYQPFFSSALQSDHRKSKFGFRSAIKLRIINELVFGGRTHTSSHLNMPRNQKVAASPPDRGGRPPSRRLALRHSAGGRAHQLPRQNQLAVRLRAAPPSAAWRGSAQLRGGEGCFRPAGMHPIMAELQVRMGSPCAPAAPPPSRSAPIVLCCTSHLGPFSHNSTMEWFQTTTNACI